MKNDLRIPADDEPVMEGLFRRPGESRQAWLKRVVDSACLYWVSDQGVLDLVRSENTDAESDEIEQAVALVRATINFGVFVGAHAAECQILQWILGDEGESSEEESEVPS